MARGAVLIWALLASSLVRADTTTPACPYKEVTPNFLSWVDPVATAARLKSEEGKRFYQSTPHTYATADGGQMEVTLGKGTTSEKNYLTVKRNGVEVNALVYVLNAEKPDYVFVEETRTPEKFRRQKASESLFKVLFELHPEMKRAEGRFSWFNFQRVAEILAGKEVLSVAEQEKLVAAAIAAPDKSALLHAVEKAPTGRVMGRLGFKADPASLQFIAGADTSNGDPLLNVVWTR